MESTQNVDKTGWPLVSAIVLCYNQARFAVECLEAIKAQNYPNLEVIINDDASKDDSVAVIERWFAKNPSITHTFLKNKVNQGICKSLNNAMRQAKGKYISGIAADDAWIPAKLRHQVKLMESLPAKVGLVYSDAFQMDEKGNELPLKFSEAAGRTTQFSKMPQGDVQIPLWQANFIAPMTTLIRRECFDRVGLYDESFFAEDWDMWLRISRYYEFVYSPEISARYRIVGTSATNGQFSRLLDDMCRTCVKHLKTNELTPGVRHAAGVKLYALATSSFVQKSPRHKQNLLQAMKYHRSGGTMARYALAWCGLGNSDFERMRAWFCGPRIETASQQSLKGETIMKDAISKLIPESAKARLRLGRAWLLSFRLPDGNSFKLSDEEQKASSLMSIIIAVHDSPRVTARCFQSLEVFAGGAEIIVVDDASKMEVTREILNDFCSRNGWKLIRHEKALGHSRSCEAGAAVSTRPYLCLLNSDTVVTHRSWAAMARTFDLSPQIAVVGPSTSHTAGPQFVNRASHCRHYWSNAQVAGFAEQYVTKHKSDEVVDLPWLGGFAFFVRRSAWDQLGGFDKNLPDYGNETDFCRRVKDAGLRIVWSKAAYIHHFGNESYGRVLGFGAINQKCLEADSYINNKWKKKLQVEKT